MVANGIAAIPTALGRAALRLSEIRYLWGPLAPFEAAATTVGCGFVGGI
jgi:hypothetical protein